MGGQDSAEFNFGDKYSQKDFQLDNGQRPNFSPNSATASANFRMSAVGSLVFCTDCGNLLESSTGDESTILICHCCGAENRDTSSKTVTTTTKPSAFPSALRQKLSAIQQVEQSDRSNEATIAQTCPECGNEEMKYYTVQLRSADEGSTVFYSCEKCGHRYNTNN